SSTDWNIFNQKIGSSTVSALSANYLSKWNTTGFANSLIYDDGSYIGIGTTSPSRSLSVHGNALISGDLHTANLIATGTTKFGGISYTWPGTQSANTYLKTDGSGGLSWATVSSSESDWQYGTNYALDMVTTSSTIPVWIKDDLYASSTVRINTAAGKDALYVGSSTAQFVVDDHGRVGIGTADPAAAMEVNGDIYLSSGADRTIKIATPGSGAGDSLTVAAAAGGSGANGGSLYLAGGTSGDAVGGNVYITGGLGGMTSGDVILAHNGVSAYGNVGIGMASPSAQLHLNTAAATDAFLIGSSTTQFIVDDHGRVGIGTSSPMTALSVTSNSGTQLTLAYDNSNYTDFKVAADGSFTIESSAGSGSLLTVGNGAEEDGGIIIDGSAQDYYMALDDTDDMFKIGLGSAVGTTPYLSIDSIGRVGISTSTPQQDFVIEDTSSGGTVADIVNYYSGGSAYSIWRATSISSTLSMGAFNSSYAAPYTSAGMVYTGSGQDLLLGTDGVWKAVIKNTTGNVGIGTTSPMYGLQVGSTAAGKDVMIDAGALCVDDNGKCAGAMTDGHIYSLSSSWEGADYAEYFYSRDTDLVPGEVVCVDIEKENAVRRCERGGDPNLIGIISSDPAIVGNNKEGNWDDPHYKITGLLGQVPAKVSSENGPIRPGD
ncbi:MAG: peptidase G2 autoproteolytic cleavage domain-containing protein, partial [Planctomycetota bacterium]